MEIENIKNNNLQHSLSKSIEEKIEINNNKNPNIHNKKKKARQNNSLEELTKKFVKYASESSDDCIDLNDIMKKMKVPKRRIYDITNVFEGKLMIILIYIFY